MMDNMKLLTSFDVEKLFYITRSQVDYGVKQGWIPQPIYVGRRGRRFIASEIDELHQEYKKGFRRKELIPLVNRLHEKRKLRYG